MVAVSISSDGVQFDALAAVRVHPAAELFPLLVGAEFTELVNDIREHGLREPIVFTPDGQLLDGRNRYRACKKIRDEEPTRRVEHAEPWAYVISTNVHRRHLSESQRAMIGAKINERHNGQRRSPVPAGTGDHESSQLPPSRAEAADLLNVGATSISRAHTVLQHGVKGLQYAVETGAVPVATAARVAAEMEPEQQQQFVQRVNNGANPRKIAPPDTESARRQRATRSAGGGQPTVGNNRSRNRHRYVNTSALRHLRDSFDALALVLDSTPDGLDPSITSEEAALWTGGLSKGASAYRRLLALLKQREQESTQ